MAEAEPSPVTGGTGTEERTATNPSISGGQPASAASPKLARHNTETGWRTALEATGEELEAELRQGLVYEYIQGEFETLPNFSQIVPNATGVVSSIAIDGETELTQMQREPNFRPNELLALGDFAVRFSGFLKVPQDGTWTFFLTSNDGSRLYISGKAVVDLDGVHYSTEKQGRVTLKAGIHPIQVLYFHRNGKMLEGIRVGPQLSVAWYLPGSYGFIGSGSKGVPKQIIPEESILYNPNDVHTQHLLATGGDPMQSPPIPPSVAKRIQILENALEEQDNRLEAMRLAFERIRAIQIFDDIRKASRIAEDRDDTYTIRDTVGGDTVDGRRTVDGTEPEGDAAAAVGGPRELEEIIDAHIEEISKLKELYFFHLGLQIKLRAHAVYPVRAAAAQKGKAKAIPPKPPVVSLQDTWEEVQEKKISVDRWPYFIAAKFGLKERGGGSRPSGPL
ncbi:PA14 domain-containing protein [Hyaloraphidium curvatum]|nr:PA14 domain-containing protein [Hyaloraphidium curvatum]